MLQTITGNKRCSSKVPTCVPMSPSP
jgi:hypothetical protein